MLGEDLVPLPLEPLLGLLRATPVGGSQVLGDEGPIVTLLLPSSMERELRSVFCKVKHALHRHSFPQHLPKRNRHACPYRLAH